MGNFFLTHCDAKTCIYNWMQPTVECYLFVKRDTWKAIIKRGFEECFHIGKLSPRSCKCWKSTPWNVKNDENYSHQRRPKYRNYPVLFIAERKQSTFGVKNMAAFLSQKFLLCMLLWLCTFIFTTVVFSFFGLILFGIHCICTGIELPVRKIIKWHVLSFVHL